MFKVAVLELVERPSHQFDMRGCAGSDVVGVHRSVRSGICGLMSNGERGGR
jgi:hypothetical protein